ncbi:MAG: extracellular solute-binding protein [Clostridiales bacterium]|nr:extracellular solute-binding protein [Clostridiales bacterium]
MKLKKALAVALAAGMTMSCAMCVSADELETISLTVWGAEEDQDLLGELASGFAETYAEYANFDIQIGVESESTAKDTILTDVEAAADVFAFPDDQLNALVSAGALLNLEEYDEMLQAYAGTSLETIKSENVEGSVDAASIDGSLYAFPRAADNGYFLYYNASVLSEEDVASWDSLLAAAAEAGGKVGMVLNSGWYNASFFYGAGFTTGLNDDGTTTIDWNGTSEDGYTGVQVTQAMLEIAANEAFMAIADGDTSNQIASGDLVAVVSGTWDAEACQTAFGDGYAATKLPTYTIGEDQVQQGSVSGYKYVGANGYSENSGWAVLLAAYMTSESSQEEYFTQRQSGPSNIAVASSDAVLENVAQAALAEQSAYGQVQRVGDKYWDPTATFGENIAQGTLAVDDEAAIQEALDTLVEGVTAAIE